MLLCLDVGNSHIFGGVFHNDELLLSFRYPSNQVSTSDQIGVFLKSVLRDNVIQSSQISDIALCSVVPHLNYSLRSACLKYFKKDPFVLQAGVRTGMRVLTKNPREIGVDRIANSIGAVNLFPKKNIIVVDFGTATTFCAIASGADYLGGPILPGLRISMEALTQNAAMLSPVNIVTAKECMGQTTESNIQSGLYYGQLGAMKEIISQLQDQAFEGQEPVVVATGGFAHLFEKERLFTTIVPDLVLHGLRLAYARNAEHMMVSS